MCLQHFMCLNLIFWFALSLSYTLSHSLSRALSPPFSLSKYHPNAVSLPLPAPHCLSHSVSPLLPPRVLSPPIFCVRALSLSLFLVLSSLQLTCARPHSVSLHPLRFFFRDVSFAFSRAVAVCCSVLQRVVARCNVSRRVALCYRAFLSHCHLSSRSLVFSCARSLSFACSLFLMCALLLVFCSQWGLYRGQNATNMYICIST